MSAAEDPLTGTRARVDEAYAAADRLVREAEQAARRAAEGVPPRGWGVPDGPPSADRLPDLGALVALVEAAKHALPPELAQRLAVALRELLLALRALLDWWIERLDPAAEAGGGPEVRDIPID